MDWINGVNEIYLYSAILLLSPWTRRAKYAFLVQQEPEWLTAAHFDIMLHISNAEVRLLTECDDLLMIWERIPADTMVKEGGRVRVLLDGAKVEHPKVLAVSVLEEFFSVLASVTVKTLDAF
jgi:hypothetical protein